jgi:hypothetical protein
MLHQSHLSRQPTVADSSDHTIESQSKQINTRHPYTLNDGQVLGQRLKQLVVLGLRSINFFLFHFIDCYFCLVVTSQTSRFKHYPLPVLDQKFVDVVGTLMLIVKLRLMVHNTFVVLKWLRPDFQDLESHSFFGEDVFGWLQEQEF